WETPGTAVGIESARAEADAGDLQPRRRGRALRRTGHKYPQSLARADQRVTGSGGRARRQGGGHVYRTVQIGQLVRAVAESRHGISYPRRAAGDRREHEGPGRGANREARPLPQGPGKLAGLLRRARGAPWLARAAASYQEGGSCECPGRCRPVTTHVRPVLPRTPVS